MSKNPSSSTLTIRRATTDDIPLIRQIAWQTFPLTYKDIITPEQCDYMMEMMYSEKSLRQQMTTDRHSYLLASVDGIVVGYVSVQPLRPETVELQKIYVLPQMQGHHIGSFLFDEAVKFVRSHYQQATHIELHVNRHNKALNFYKHKGMHELRRGDFPIGHGFYMNDFIMGLDL